MSSVTQRFTLPSESFWTLFVLIIPTCHLILFASVISSTATSRSSIIVKQQKNTNQTLFKSLVLNRTISYEIFKNSDQYCYELVVYRDGDSANGLIHLCLSEDNYRLITSDRKQIDSIIGAGITFCTHASNLTGHVTGFRILVVGRCWQPIKTSAHHRSPRSDIWCLQPSGSVSVDAV